MKYWLYQAQNDDHQYTYELMKTYEILIKSNSIGANYDIRNCLISANCKEDCKEKKDQQVSSR